MSTTDALVYFEQYDNERVALIRADLAALRERLAAAERERERDEARQLTNPGSFLMKQIEALQSAAAGKWRRMADDFQCGETWEQYAKEQSARAKTAEAEVARLREASPLDDELRELLVHYFEQHWRTCCPEPLDDDASGCNAAVRLRDALVARGIVKDAP